MEDQNETRNETSDVVPEAPKTGVSRRKFLIGAGVLGASLGLGRGMFSTRKTGLAHAAGSGDTDFLFIGAGHNSLSCAMLLAKAGHKVLILDSASEIGGCAKTKEVTLPGFKHDLYAANIGLFMGSATFSEFGKDLFQEGFKPVVSDAPMASVFPDNTGMAIYKDADKTYNSFKQVSQHDADAWIELLAYFKETSPHFLPFFQVEMPSFAAFRMGFSAVRKLGVKGSYELAQMLLKSPREYTRYWFDHPKTRALFTPWAMHLDFGPDVSGGAAFPFVEPPIYFNYGMPLSEGGVGNLIKSMGNIVEKHGGAIETGQKVDHVLINNGRAVGVQTADGRKIHAQKAVIANVNPHVLVDQLIDPAQLPGGYVKRFRKYRFGPGTMMIHLALSGPVEWAAGSEFGKFNYVHIAPYSRDLSQTYTDAMNGTLPESPLLIVGQLSVTDPTRVPAGKQLLWIQVRVLPAVPKADAVSGTGAITPAPWSQIKEQYADRVLDKLEMYAPGVKGKILKRVVYSPADLENENPNLGGGDSIAGSHHLDQFYMFRPIPGWSRYETPVKGLYMVGAATWPGAGLHATSGYLLGQELLDL